MTDIKINGKTCLVLSANDGDICKFGWFNCAHQLIPWEFFLGKNETIIKWEVQGENLVMFKEKELNNWQRQTYETERLMYGYKYTGDPYKPKTVAFSVKELLESIDSSSKFYKGYSEEFLMENLKASVPFSQVDEFRLLFTRYDIQMHLTDTEDEAESLRKKYNRAIVAAYPCLTVRALTSSVQDNP